MVCLFHDDKNPSLYIKEGNSGDSFYKCFACGESGDIISFIRKVENMTFFNALKKAYEILEKSLDLPKYNKRENASTYTDRQNYSRSNMVSNNKEATINFYNKKIQEAKAKGLHSVVEELENLKLKEETTNYQIDFPYMDYLVVI